MANFKFYFTAVFVCLFICLQAQVKSVDAVKINERIKLDGNLDEHVWQTVPDATDFISLYPVIGQPSTRKSVVKIAYDDMAVYVGAYFYDSAVNIRRQLTARDVIDRQNTDVFTIGLDTYKDRQNAFIFQITPAGVQGDARESQSASASGTSVIFDRSWDAVWESKTSIKNDGWVAEIKIPFSAIRFAKKDVQTWGLNFGRFTRKINENSTWNPINPNLSGDVNQWGNWSGLKDVTPPLRLSFSPYLSGGIRVSPTGNGTVTENLKSGGMDVKYGINESFTLDMTLIPDFAQVQSDNVFLNLSPFEIKFDDYRPFFTEGTELFNKAGLFYSRRIGAAPTGAAGVLQKYGTDNSLYQIEKNPGITKLYNATKLSGRTKNNLGIGVLNAVSAPMYAALQHKSNDTDSTILTEPLTNYNILVVDKLLKNRSSFTFTNTNVLRKGNNRNANVSGLDFSFFDKKNIHNYSFSGKYSYIWGKQQTVGGFKSETSYGKVSGLVRYLAGVSVISNTYDPNDLGFLLNNNMFSYQGSVSYNMLKATKKLLNYSYKLNVSNNYLYKPFVWTDFKIGANAHYLFKNFWDVSVQFETKPFWYNDYFEPRTAGKVLKRTPYYFLGVGGSTDSRKKLFVNYFLGGAESPLPNDPFWTATLGFRYRFSDKFQVSSSMVSDRDKGNWGFSYRDDFGEPIIARRNVNKNTLIFSSQYNFTARMNWTIRMRHNWTYLSNTNFYNLKNDGYWNEIPFQENRNRNFNSFNIDMFYIWDFLWGSRITLAWKNAIGSNVYLDPYQNDKYIHNFTKMFNNPHSNELTVKVVYFLDHLKFLRRH
jgi:hypothetical protein